MEQVRIVDQVIDRYTTGSDANTAAKGAKGKVAKALEKALSDPLTDAVEKARQRQKDLLKESPKPAAETIDQRVTRYRQDIVRNSDGIRANQADIQKIATYLGLTL